MIVRYSDLQIRENVIADVEDTLNRHLNIVFCNVGRIASCRNSVLFRRRAISFSLETHFRMRSIRV